MKRNNYQKDNLLRINGEYMLIMKSKGKNFVSIRLNSSYFLHRPTLILIKFNFPDVIFISCICLFSLLSFIQSHIFLFSLITCILFFFACSPKSNLLRLEN